MSFKSFASDNTAGVHPTIFQALHEANHHGHAKAYGEDESTEAAINLFKQQFGKDAEVFFVCNGTAANVLGLSALLKSYQSVICVDSAHINVAECGAVEKYIGSTLQTVSTKDGKITVEDIQRKLQRGDQHQVQSKVVSISQSTEWATVYSQEELKKITKFAHAQGLLVHMDGARLSNAAAALNTSLASMTQHVGIDVLSFGGTKNGMMLGEAVVFFNPALAEDFKYLRKQGMQLVSKMRFISTQFIALLTNDLWLKNAKHANAMAKLLAAEVAKIPQVQVTQEVQTNAVFAYLEPQLIAKLQQHYYFYIWNETTSEVRWMTSWDTTEQDIQAFVLCIKQLL